jgi:hypothetical protein
MTILLGELLKGGRRWIHVKIRGRMVVKDNLRILHERHTGALVENVSSNINSGVSSIATFFTRCI